MIPRPPALRFRFLAPVFCLLVGLGACAERIEQPFFTAPPQVILPTGVRVEPPQVAICYSSNTTTEAALREKVLSACTDPQLLRQDLTGDCTLVQPVRATFSCTAVDAEVAKIETPYRRVVDRNRFRLDPQVLSEQPKEDKR